MADDQSSLLLRALGAMILLNLNGQSFNAGVNCAIPFYFPLQFLNRNSLNQI
jgi:hypothetical protein